MHKNLHILVEILKSIANFMQDQPNILKYVLLILASESIRKPCKNCVNSRKLEMKITIWIGLQVFFFFFDLLIIYIFLIILK